MAAPESKRQRRTGVTVVLGGQWGDEGKGKLVDILAQDADVVCRCQVRGAAASAQWGELQCAPLPLSVSLYRAAITRDTR